MNYVGIDIGGTKVKIGLIDEGGKIVKKTDIDTLATRNASEVIADIVQAVKSLTSGIEYKAVGVGCPGAIDSCNGIVLYANNLYWKNVPLANSISNALKKPCFVANDANVAALGEVKYGAGKSYSDAIMITLGTGVGSGFVVDGKLFEGYKSMGTEGGHIVIRSGGVKCTCGREGCWEVYASAVALTRETLYAMFSDKNSLMWQECGGDLDAVDGRTSFEAAKKGDATAMEVVKNYCCAVGEGIANLVNIFRSQVIILGGGVCAQGEYLVKPVQEFVDKNRYGGADSLRSVVVTASLGNNAGILGGAALCKEKCGA